MFDVENIPYGHENAVQRPANPIMDRILRGNPEQYKYLKDNHILKELDD